jgi:hypothetical protein
MVRRFLTTGEMTHVSLPTPVEESVENYKGVISSQQPAASSYL